MKFHINQNELFSALNILKLGISAHTNIPILNGIYLNVKEHQIKLQSTDTQLSVQLDLDALIETTGSTVVPAKLFTEIIKSLNDQLVTLELQESTLIITSGSASFKLKTMDPEEYPKLSQANLENQIKLPLDVFTKLVKRVYKIASKDKSRPLLNGILIRKQETLLKMVATDSYRIAIAQEIIDPQNEIEDFELIAPAQFLFELVSLPINESDIAISLSENQIVINYKNITFINRVIEGTYPEYERIIPSNINSVVTTNKDFLIAAIKRTLPFVVANEPVSFDLNVESQTIKVETSSKDKGIGQEILAAEIQGENIFVGFNHAYIQDGLQLISGEEVVLEFVDSRSPVIIKSKNISDNFMYLIVPVRL